MNPSHSKYRWKNPKQRCMITKFSNVFKRKYHTRPNCFFKNSTELNIQNAINVIQTSTESRREITWWLIKHKQFNWRKVTEEVLAGRGEPRRNGEASEMEKVAPHYQLWARIRKRVNTVEHWMGASGSQVSFLEFWQCSTSWTEWWFHGWLLCDKIFDAYISALSTIRRLNN